jgi:hypothetical protein
MSLESFCSERIAPHRTSIRLNGSANVGFLLPRLAASALAEAFLMSESMLRYDFIADNQDVCHKGSGVL